MGVSGVGKSTIGHLLSKELNVPFFDGDDFHTEKNILKMSNGEALNDDDRFDWLQTLNKLAIVQLKDKGCIIVCSALKEKYLTILNTNIKDSVKWVFLNGSFDQIKEIINQISIDNRPKHIDLRNEVGHWEGDLVIGKNHKSAIGTIVERKTRFTLIVKLESKKAGEVANKFSKILNKLNPIYKKSMTYDNGIEMARHEIITKNTGMKIYFAHPYSSWERGTNENTNGLIRRYLPKGTNFNEIDLNQLQIIQEKLNNRPRKIIGYKTPQEMIDLELKFVA